VKPPHRSTDRAEAIAAKISELVTLGVYAPGLQLRQTSLAQKFSASRAPVREALRRLAAEGILEHDLHRGFFIAHLSSDDAGQLYRLRHLLEREVLSSSHWPTRSQLAALERDVAQLDELMKAGKRGEWTIRHPEFLRKVFELSPQRFVVREVLRLRALTDRYRSLAAPEPRDARRPSTERHVVKALAARDRDRLLKLFADDCSRSEQRLIGSLSARGL
jgi:DNA-binding GntR family transcriptional regulator